MMYQEGDIVDGKEVVEAFRCDCQHHDEEPMYRLRTPSGTEIEVLASDVEGEEP